MEGAGYMKKLHLTRQEIRRGAIFLLTALISAFLLYAANQYIASETISFVGENTNEYVKAEVLKILSKEDTLISPDNVNSVGGYSITYQARIYGGDLDGLEVTALQNYDPFVPVQNRQVETKSSFTAMLPARFPPGLLGIMFAATLCSSSW